MKITSLSRYLFLIPALFITMLSCRNRQTEVVMPAQPENKISESKIVLSRYEKALFALDKRKLKTGMATLYPEYSFFLGSNWQDTRHDEELMAALSRLVSEQAGEPVSLA